MAARDDDAYFGIDPRLDSAMGQLEQQRRGFEESHRRRQEQRTTAKAKDQSFSVTFDGGGDLVDLTFHGTKYRSAAPAELAAQIVATMRRGRTEALEKMVGSMAMPGMEGVDLAGLASGKADPTEVLDAILAPIFKSVSAPRPGGGPRE